MAVKIKLKRLGKIHHPQYRIVVADSRAKRGGRAIEEIGFYDAKPNPSIIEVDSERVQYWLSVGAKPTESVQKLLSVTGDWAKFTGEGDPAGRLEVAPAKEDKSAAFATAVAAAATADNAQAAKKAAAKVNPVESVAEEAAEVAVEALEVVDTVAEAQAAAVEADSKE